MILYRITEPADLSNRVYLPRELYLVWFRMAHPRVIVDHVEVPKDATLVIHKREFCQHTARCKGYATRWNTHTVSPAEIIIQFLDGSADSCFYYEWEPVHIPRDVLSKILDIREGV